MGANTGCKLEFLRNMAKEYDSKKSFLRGHKLVDAIADAREGTKVMFQYFFEGGGATSFQRTIRMRSTVSWTPVGSGLRTPYLVTQGLPQPPVSTRMKFKGCSTTMGRSAVAGTSR